MSIEDAAAQQPGKRSSPQDHPAFNALSDTGQWRIMAREVHTRQGWAGSGGYGDRPTTPRNPLRVYTTRAVIWDSVAIVAAAAIGFVLRWTIPYNLDLTDATYVLLALVVVVSWSIALVLFGAYDSRILGVGSEEFKRVVTASAAVFAGVAIIAFAFKLDLSRGFVLITFVAGLTLILTVRWALRAWLRHERRYGHYLHRTIVVGSGERQAEIVDLLGRDPVAGFTVVDVVEEPASDIAEDALDTWLDEVMTRIALEEADTVAVAGSPQLGQWVIKRLSWRLEGPRIDLIVAPTLGDFAGPRVSMRMAADLPLLHLDEPHLAGPKRAIKRALDIVFGSALLVMFTPFMLVASIGTLMTSRGPILYTQERIGRSGELIRIRKFRTMYVGSDAKRDEIIGSPDLSILERYRRDPRITPFGRFLRRWSIDEMPQVVNVIAGSMSLVGPRPVLLDEIPLLDDADHRRHLTKPGLTGLWQVSGRKTVDWDERMRLDLDYVEHWSPALDLVIVAKTVKAVVMGDGAY
jgi:exopolysaccharide biosynthesis polyprenyl glycosylphosphotransferase